MYHLNKNKWIPGQGYSINYREGLKPTGSRSITIWYPFPDPIREFCFACWKENARLVSKSLFGLCNGYPRSFGTKYPAGGCGKGWPRTMRRIHFCHHPQHLGKRSPPRKLFWCGSLTRSIANTDVLEITWWRSCGSSNDQIAIHFPDVGWIWIIT